MRTIKFRGKFNSIRAAVKPKNDGSWVYGDLVHNVIFSGGKLCDAIYDGSDFVPVNSATVGQFTGLLDKNGKEIYEGDIIDIGDGEYSVVSYSDSHALFDLSPNGLFSQEAIIYGCFEVVGNMFDNLDLLK